MAKKILVISHDRVGQSMAGPGIRYHQIATRLSIRHNVTLAVFNPAYIDNIGKTKYRAIDIHVQNFKQEFAKYDAIIALWLSDEMIEFAKSKGIVLIFDLYAPVPVEDLVQRVFCGNTNPESDYDYGQMIRNYKYFIKNGDYLLTSNLHQRDFWMGYAFASNKISPSEQKDRSIDSYFGICPMGIDLNEVKNAKLSDMLSLRIPAIKKDDFIIVWTGGIWDWFDAKTPIESIDSLVKGGRNNIKLVFLGTKHPNDDVPAMAETEIARNYATKLGLIDEYVFFLDGWLPYNSRIHYLSRANAAVYAHKPSVESRFSHRTRVLDHILMCLPTIATKGDYFSDYIEEHGLGLSVEPFDSKSMSIAITKIADNKKLSDLIVDNIKKNQPFFTWDYTLKPLEEFIDSKIFRSSAYIMRTATTPSELIISSRPISIIKKIVPKKIKNAIKRVIR